MHDDGDVAGAMRALAGSLRPLADAARVRAQVKRDLAPLVPAGRPVDGLGRQVPRNPFAERSGRLRLLLGLPGFAGLWVKAVPKAHVHEVCVVAGREEAVVVVCPCGGRPVVLLHDVVECPGGCFRFFVSLVGGVRVRVLAPAAEEEPEAVAA